MKYEKSPRGVLNNRAFPVDEGRRDVIIKAMKVKDGRLVEEDCACVRCVIPWRVEGMMDLLTSINLDQPRHCPGLYPRGRQ